MLLNVVVAGLEVYIIWIGLIVVSMRGVHDVVEAGRLRYIERAQKQRIENAEDDNVRANTEGQREQGSRRKCGRLHQLTQGKTTILNESTHDPLSRLHDKDRNYVTVCPFNIRISKRNSGAIFELLFSQRSCWIYAS